MLIGAKDSKKSAMLVLIFIVNAPVLQGLPMLPNSVAGTLNLP